MKLYFGGRGQGQLEAALAENGLSAGDVLDGASCPLDAPVDAAVFANLHLYVRRLQEAGLDPGTAVRRIAEQNPGIIWVADEVGCGVVPLGRRERDWRDAAGRACCALVPRCERVCRVFCGIVTALKG